MSRIHPEVLKTLKSDTLNKINQGNKRVHSFNVDYSDVNPDFIGKFTVRYPSQLERMQIGVTKSSLLGGNLDVDVVTDNIAHIISTLDVMLEEKPVWFDVSNSELAYDIMESVFMEYQNWVNSFRISNKPVNNDRNSQDGGIKVPMVDTENIPSTTNG